MSCIFAEISDKNFYIYYTYEILNTLCLSPSVEPSDSQQDHVQLSCFPSWCVPTTCHSRHVSCFVCLMSRLCHRFIIIHFCCGKRDFVCWSVEIKLTMEQHLEDHKKQNKHCTRQITVTYPPGCRSCSMLKISLIKMPLALPLDTSADFVTNVDDGKNMIWFVWSTDPHGVELSHHLNHNNKYFYPKWMWVIRLMCTPNWNCSVVGPKWANIKHPRLLSITSWAIHKEHDYFIHNQLQPV